MARKEEQQRKGGKEGKEEKGKKRENERRPPQDDAELDAFIRALVDSFPPLTEEQESLLALLFSGIVDE